MNQQAVDVSEALWQHLVECNRERMVAFREFLADQVDRVPWLRKGLRAGGVDRATAIQVIPYLDITERRRLYGDLVFLASSAHGSIEAIRHLLLGLPRDYLLQTIEGEAEAYLQNGTDDEYRRFLELYEMLDRDLTLKLARRAAAHSDANIREAGEEFLKKLLGPEFKAERH